MLDACVRHLKYCITFNILPFHKNFFLSFCQVFISIYTIYLYIIHLYIYCWTCILQFETDKNISPKRTRKKMSMIWKTFSFFNPIQYIIYTYLRLRRNVKNFLYICTQNDYILFLYIYGIEHKERNNILNFDKICIFTCILAFLFSFSYLCLVYSFIEKDIKIYYTHEWYCKIVQG